MIVALTITLIAFLLLRNAWNVLKILHRLERMLKDIPNPPGIPIFRCLFEFISSEKVFDNAMKYQKRYGGVVKINLFAYLSGIMLTDRKVNELILTSNTLLNKSMTYYFLRRWLGSGLLTSEGHLSNALRHVANHGGIVKYDLFSLFSAVIITDYRMLELLLTSREVLNKSFVYVFLKRWLGSGLLTSKSQKWRKTRKIITPAFHFQILEQYVDTFHSSGERLIEILRRKVGKGPFDVYPYITPCTLDIICETAMGTRINAQENYNSEYVQSVKEMCRIVLDRTRSPLKIFDSFYWLSRDYWKEKRHLKVMQEFTTSVIKRRREELSVSKRDESAAREKKTKKKKKLAFLDLLLESNIDDRPMIDDEIRQEVDTFMFAGHDTTAAGICFTLYCLSKHPQVQQKAVEELQSIFGGDRNQTTTYKELLEMKYLEMVIKESLRLYPPVPVFSRQPEEDVVYSDGVLPAKSQLGIFAYGVHRNPVYYPDPEKFDPERFTLENQTARPPFSFLAFSAGPRNCIGQKFAMLEMKMVLSKILRNFRVAGVEGYSPRLAPLVVLRSLNGILIKLEERMPQ